MSSTHHHQPTAEQEPSSAAVDVMVVTSAEHVLENGGGGGVATTQQRVRFMCSFGGKILPRPHDNQLRYVGGDTRIVSFFRGTTFAHLLSKLSKLSGTTDIIVKYQLPNEDLDALITVTSDEDVENMMDEYDRLSHSQKTARLRLFLFPMEGLSRNNSISSLLDGSVKREHWFLDALNGGPGLERGRSEVSSIVSEVPDYLFGLDNSDDQPRDPKPKHRTLVHDNATHSDPGSPIPPGPSRFGSNSSVTLPQMSDLPPVKVRSASPAPVYHEPKESHAENVVVSSESTIMKQPDYPGQPTWQYVGSPRYQMTAMQNMPVPVYIIPGSAPHGNAPNVPMQQVPIRVPYGQPFPPPPGQFQVGLPQQQLANMGQQVANMGQIFSGVRPISSGDPHEMSGRFNEIPHQPMYYGVRTAIPPAAYPGMVVTSSEEIQVPVVDPKTGRVPQSS